MKLTLKILDLAAVMPVSSASLAKTGKPVTDPYEVVEVLKAENVEAPIFGGKRYKKRKIQRQNTVDKTNRRTKKINRKNGIGHSETIKWEEVAHG